MKAIDLKTGINVLLGPNGCGKSTLLHLLADTFMCAEGQVPTVTVDALRKFEKDPGFQVHHDGSPVGFLDPAHEVGLEGGAFSNEIGRAHV